jgi:hypothetical protein
MSHPRPLPIQRAFVVQLHAEANVAHGRMMGRVEHVQSGQAARFHTLDELLEFFSAHGARPDRPVSPTDTLTGRRWPS